MNVSRKLTRSIFHVRNSQTLLVFPTYCLCWSILDTKEPKLGLLLSWGYCSKVELSVLEGLWINGFPVRWLFLFMPTERACREQMAVIRHRMAPDDGAFPTLSSERAQTNLAVGSCPVTAWASYTACSELCALVSLGQRDWFPEWETWNNPQP